MVRVVDKVSGPESRFVALVTGSTGAIGRAIAERIAVRPEYEVVLLCRDAAKAETTVDAIRRQTGNPHARYEHVDLSRRASVSALAERWRRPAHTLVNNAAITPRRRRLVPEPQPGFRWSRNPGSGFEHPRVAGDRRCCFQH